MRKTRQQRKAQILEFMSTGYGDRGRYSGGWFMSEIAHTAGLKMTPYIRELVTELHQEGMIVFEIPRNLHAGGRVWSIAPNISARDIQQYITAATG